MRDQWGVQDTPGKGSSWSPPASSRRPGRAAGRSPGWAGTLQASVTGRGGGERADQSGGVASGFGLLAASFTALQRRRQEQVSRHPRTCAVLDDLQRRQAVQLHSLQRSVGGLRRGCSRPRHGCLPLQELRQILLVANHSGEGALLSGSERARRKRVGGKTRRPPVPHGAATTACGPRLRGTVA